MRFNGPLMVINHPPDEVIGSCRLLLVSASPRLALCHVGNKLLIRVNGGGSPTISMHDSMVVVWDTPVKTNAEQGPGFVERSKMKKSAASRWGLQERILTHCLSKTHRDQTTWEKAHARAKKRSATFTRSCLQPLYVKRDRVGIFVWHDKLAIVCLSKFPLHVQLHLRWTQASSTCAGRSQNVHSSYSAVRGHAGQSTRRKRRLPSRRQYC